MGVQVRQKIKGKGKPWWVFVSHKGRRTSKQIGSKGAARNVERKIEAKLALGEFGFEDEKPVPTFQEYYKKYFVMYSKINHKRSTIDSYENVFNKHVMPVFGKEKLNEIKRANIKDFLIQKQTSGLAPNSVKIMKSYISAVLTQAVDDEIIENNPASRTGKYIKNDNKEGKANPFTWDEKVLFEQTAEKHFYKHYPLFLCALRTGMREGELIALKPGDIDFNGGFIEVQRNCVRGTVTTPKNGKTRRVDMSDQLASFLKTYLTERKLEALKKGWGEPPEWLFYNEDGKLIDVNNLRKRVFYKCLEKAGLKRIRFHDLRSTYATLRIQAGHNIADVSKQLGHSSIKVTVDVYYKWIPGISKDEVNDLDLNCAPKCTLSAPKDNLDDKKRLTASANLL